MIKRKLMVACALAAGSTILLAPSAFAGGKIEIDDTKWVSAGAGLRTSMNSVENAAPSGSDRSTDLQIDNVRLYFNGQIHENVSFTFNTNASTDNNGANDVEDLVVLDVIAKFSFSDMFNVWMGRHLPPSDRSTLSGPFYLNAWSFPIAQKYPAKIGGRDDGVSVWGDSGMFKYQVGIYEGTETASNQKDKTLLASRFTLNLWDPEPGYGNSSTYYGAKDILAFGFVYQSQADSQGTVTDAGDFTGMSLDALFEKKMAGGVVTAEAAYYSYDYDNKSGDSNGYFVLGSYLFGNNMGMGKLQPMLRYQSVEVDGLGGAMGTDTEQLDVGLNYIIDGHNARISLVYEANEETTGGTSTDTNAIRLGVQLQM
ncbi:FmdC precursor [hydrothermal vent metagenome]|uniref:FmdC n=1 Tax=hydrothermal vent metagenome TaxID=652676 RepID=A0A3B0Z8Q1_9ZZZZ